MGALGTLLAYAFLGLAAISAIAWGNNILGHHYTDPVVAEYEAKLKNAKDRAKEAEDANVSLRASVDKVKEEINSCNAKTDEFEAKSKAAAAAAADAIAKAKAAGVATDLTLKALRAKASGPATAGNACAQADAILSDLATDVRAALGLVTITGPQRLPPPLR